MSVCMCVVCACVYVCDVCVCVYVCVGWFLQKQKVTIFVRAGSFHRESTDWFHRESKDWFHRDSKDWLDKD